MKYCSCKEINALVKALVQDGWSFCRGGKHGKLLEPSGKFVLTVPSSPSDHRAFLNFKRDVRHVLSSLAM
jgi:hypothetical protein